MGSSSQTSFRVRQHKISSLEAFYPLFNLANTRRIRSRAHRQGESSTSFHPTVNQHTGNTSSWLKLCTYLLRSRARNTLRPILMHSSFDQLKAQLLPIPNPKFKSGFSQPNSFPARRSRSPSGYLGGPRGSTDYLSWKVRYRTFPWFFSQMSKLYRARSLLYRRQILQVNIRWKALDEIYKIYMLLHRSDLNISENVFVKLFRIFQ